MEFFPRLVGDNSESSDTEGDDTTNSSSSRAQSQLNMQPLQILLTLDDNLFVRIPVPKRGVVCSNQSRVERICSILENRVSYEVPWGPKIFIGEYKGHSFFIASAPVGSGSGLMFTELYAAGAEYIVRYGSDDVKSPGKYEQDIVKIIDEADNLYGFSMASGVPKEEWGKSVYASPVLVKCLRDESARRKLAVETRICHHLENYHSLRTPHKFAPPRESILKTQLAQLEANKRASSVTVAAYDKSQTVVADNATINDENHTKKSSFDMETAVLFRVAKDFTGYVMTEAATDTATAIGADSTRTNGEKRYVHKHAASVLQTVNKESVQTGPYEGANKTAALALEHVFIDFILSALLRLPIDIIA